MTDTIKLKIEITKSQLTLKFIAESIGITPYSLTKKINNVTEFKASEISALSKLLHIKNVDEIFFAKNVENNSPNNY